MRAYQLLPSHSKIRSLEMDENLFRIRFAYPFLPREGSSGAIGDGGHKRCDFLRSRTFSDYPAFQSVTAELQPIKWLRDTVANPLVLVRLWKRNFLYPLICEQVALWLYINCSENLRVK
jgi:hypothetical protein